MPRSHIRINAARPIGPLRCKNRIVRQTPATWSAEELWSSDYTWDGESPLVSAEWADSEIWSGADTWGGSAVAATTTNLLRSARIIGLRI